MKIKPNRDFYLQNSLVKQVRDKGLLDLPFFVHLILTIPFITFRLRFQCGNDSHIATAGERGTGLSNCQQVPTTTASAGLQSDD